MCMVDWWKIEWGQRIITIVVIRKDSVKFRLNKEKNALIELDDTDD
jgi:hypothetical protein